MNTISGSQWRHYKHGETYFILLDATQESNLEPQFVYAQLRENNCLNRLLLRSLLAAINLLIQKVWVRSEDDFLSPAKVGDRVAPRFRRID